MGGLPVQLYVGFVSFDFNMIEGFLSGFLPTSPTPSSKPAHASNCIHLGWIDWKVFLENEITEKNKKKNKSQVIDTVLEPSLMCFKALVF